MDIPNKILKFSNLYLKNLYMIVLISLENMMMIYVIGLNGLMVVATKMFDFGIGRMIF